MDRQKIEKIAQTPEDKHLLARIWDKINAGIRKNIPANTHFLSPREQAMAQFLFGDLPGLSFFGGYPEAERQMLCWLPDYLDEGYLQSDESPLVCLRATFWSGDALSHRDFLGALTGAGVTRDVLGDICVAPECCHLFAAREIAPYLLQNFTQAGRAHLHLEQIPLEQAEIPKPKTKEIRDTVASLRLDSIIASGFRISRGHAGEWIAAGKAAVNGLPCQKPDKAVAEGDKISVRGLGKIKIRTVSGQTKKGRISVVIDRYE